MRRLALLGSGTLLLIVAASVAFPHAVLSPGDLARGHAAIEGACFSCHAPFRGPACGGCHDAEEIESPGRPRFHFALLERECSACHTDHEGRARSVREFRHELLRPDLRGECGGCHAPPADETHAGAGEGCGKCHGTAGWKPSTFRHDGFRFDRDHPAACRTCHPAGHSAYTCYGCHEHEEREMAEEHAKEGIADFAECSRCHRGGEAEGVRGQEDDGPRRRRGRDR